MEKKKKNCYPQVTTLGKSLYRCKKQVIILKESNLALVIIQPSSLQTKWTNFKSCDRFNLKEAENVFCVPSLNRLIHDLSDHGALKEPKNPLDRKSVV